MTVTKRVRFEVLRRDEHTCQYCGQMAPDVVLTVDHVVPVSLGGSDDPSNLVAACRDCNAGKSSISPDSPIVAAVSARSAEFALAQANVASHIRADLGAIRDYSTEFEDAWKAWGRGDGEERQGIPLPPDWRRSVTTWWRMSVPLELLLESIPTAMTAKGKGYAGIGDQDRFRYFAGIVWRTLEEYDATYPVGSNSGRVYSSDEREAYAVQQWNEGYEKGIRRVGEQALGAAITTFDYCGEVAASRDFLRHHVDGTTPPPVKAKTFGELAGAF